ncbi:hypothetical protein [Blastomonas sp. CACIA14H2]|jgi:hypothetical protein|uniref:hypothetical protein n=1 Tax=Blastomonas sp. CACIA14H2 TaxID=1419876 RepID=UPI004059C440
MKTQDLILLFSKVETLPVDVNDVLKCLRDNGHDDDIEFIGVDLDPEILQGQIKIFWSHNGVYGEPTRCANIYYHRGHESDWQRFIACKELLHLLDSELAHTKSQQDIDLLAEKIGLPPEMQDPTSDGFQANVDRVAEWRAAAILLPLASRNLLHAAYKNGSINASDIARLADIPRRYVGLVMSDAWPGVHEILTTPPENV